MNEREKYQIKALRNQGLGYIKIAQRVGLSVNTVKSFCKRNSLEKVKPKLEINETKCEECGKTVIQRKGIRFKRFCCDKCRNSWWARNKDKVNYKNVQTLVCPACNKEFTAVGNKQRKYCCHDCYIKHRFGGEHGEK